MAIVSNLMYAVGFKISDGALRKSEKQVEGLNEKWVGIGIAAGAVATAVVGIGFAATNAATEFGQSMASMEQATNLTAEQMEETKGIAKDLYNQNFGESWAHLGDSIATVQQNTGLTGDALKESTQDALLFADAFNQDVGESSAAVSAAMDNFGVSSREAYNLLSQGTKQGMNAQGDLLDTINEYSPAFSSLGMSAEDTFNFIAAGLDAGARSTDLVADAVNEFSILSIDASKSTMDAYEALGLNADEMMNTFASGGDGAKSAFQDIISMISDIEDPVVQNAIGVALFGTQFEELGMKAFSALGDVQSQFDMTKDTMGELNEIKFNSPGEAFSRIGRQLETSFLIPLGEKLMPYLSDFSGWLEDIGPSLSNFAGGLVDGVGGAIEAVSGGFQFLSDHIGIIGPALAPLATVIGVALVLAMKAWALSMWPAVTASWALMAPWLPFIALAIGIGAAIAGIILVIKNWGTVGPWLQNIWNVTFTWVKNLFSGMIDFFVTWGTAAWNAVTTYISGLVNDAKALWNNFWTATSTIFTNLWNSIVSIWDSIVSAISTAGSNVYDTITGIWDQIKITADNLWTGISNGVTGMWESIKGGFVSGINWLIDKLNSMIGKVNNALSVDLPDWMGGGFDVNIPTIPTVDGSHANGLGFVPYDGYIAELHEGERVLTKEENEAYSSGEPSLAPARASGGATTTTTQQDINLNITIDAPSMGSAEKAAILAEIRAIFESVVRRQGLEVSFD